MTDYVKREDVKDAIAEFGGPDSLALLRRMTALPSAPVSEERGELQNIVNAKRFDSRVFSDDTAFADWAQSRARHALKIHELLALPSAPVSEEREECAQRCESWRYEVRQDSLRDTLIDAARLLRAPQQQTEPVAEITDVQGSLNDICIVTWRKNQPIPPAGTLLYTGPPAQPSESRAAKLERRGVPFFVVKASEPYARQVVALIKAHEGNAWTTEDEAWAESVLPPAQQAEPENGRERLLQLLERSQGAEADLAAMLIRAERAEAENERLREAIAVLRDPLLYAASPPDDEAVRLIAQFGAWCLETLREDFGDLDGGSVQDEAQRLGILVNVPVTEPCGESCSCAEYDDFPQDCLRYSELVRAYISRKEKP